MTYLDLLLGFLKVGCFAFGGAYAAIPLIRDIVISYNWIGDEMLSYLIAVSESTPGPIMINTATYVGSIVAGLVGSLIATFAVALPAFVIILLIMAVFKRLIDNKIFVSILSALRPCVIGIILATGVYMAIENLFGADIKGFDLRALILSTVLALIFYLPRIFKKKVSSILLIIISAVLGAVVYGI